MSIKNKSKLSDFLKAEWQANQVTDTLVFKAVDAISSKFEGSLQAILFYGSCLKTGEIEDNVIDFYLIVDDYSSAYENAYLRAANAMIPPNVFYWEGDIDGITLRSKYAVISEEDFSKRSQNILNSAIWARFSQPSVPVYCRDDVAERAILTAITDAHITMVQESLTLFPKGASSRALWVKALEMTYGSEMRSERAEKPLELYLSNQDRYETITEICYEILGISCSVHLTKQPSSVTRIAPKLRWFLRRVNGRFVSLLRLVKASTTFKGGIDYLAWKIKRHSGVDIEVTPWMRKHQFFGGIKAYWQIRGKGAIR